MKNSPGIQRRGLDPTFEPGVAKTVDIPLSEDGIAIDHVLGAANYRSLRAHEVRTTQIIFRRLPVAPPNARN